MKLFFLGPRGTYSEVVALQIQKFLENIELEPVSTIAKIVDLVNKSDDAAILPIENSIEGIVRSSVDNIYSSDVKIQAQIEIKIEHCLISKTSDIRKIKHIISHPQALAQCQKYILQNFDEKIDLINSSSTASAGESLKEKDESYGAIVSSALADKLNYNVIDRNIGDIKENRTRFV